MARMEIRGFDELELQLSKLADPEISKEVVQAGAQQLPTDKEKRGTSEINLDI